jgi:hypothetical protein
MKTVLFALVALSFSSAFANNNCTNDPTCFGDKDYDYRTCRASDSYGNVYKYTTPTDWNEPYTKKQAVKKCKENSPAPATCKATSCVEFG